MEQEKLDLFMISNQKYFPAEKIQFIIDKLKNLPDERSNTIYAVDLKDPMTMLIVSLFGGWLGIDRFMLGDTGLGILKLLTCGCCGIFTVIDWFLIMGKTKENNYKNFMMIL